MVLNDDDDDDHCVERNSEEKNKKIVDVNVKAREKEFPVSISMWI